MLSFARGHLKSAFLHKHLPYGLSEELHTRVTDPTLKDIFETQTLWN